MVTCTLDGQTVEVDPGTTILTAARSVGVDIPTFCYHQRLSLSASCRMCLVEVEGRNKLEPACATAIAPDMVIHSRSDKVVATREDMLEMLLANHPLDCPICDKGGECELQDTVFEYGKGDSRLQDPKRVFRQRDIELNQVIVFNANRCIQCQRCVRVCEEVVGEVALGTVERGLDSEITGVGNSLKDCSHCGNCIEVCPVGALMSVPYRYKARPWDLVKTETICGMCGTGCSLTVETREGIFKRVKSDPDTGLNGELLCAKGRFGFDAIDGGQRIELPMIRKDGALIPVSWDEVINFISEKARAVRDRKGRIQGLISPRQTNETAFMFQTLMRQVFGSQDIHSSTRFGGLRSETAIQALARVMTGVVDRKPLGTVLEAECIFLLGSNITEENPVTGYLLRTAMRGKHKQLIIASSRPCGLDDIADVSMRLLPGNEAHLLAQLIKEEASGAGNAIGDFVSSAKASLVAADSIALLIGTEFLRSSNAEDCLRWIEQATETFKAQGKSVTVQFLFDRPNQLGLWDMGCLAGVAPGWQRSQERASTSDAPPVLVYVMGAKSLGSGSETDPIGLTVSKHSCLVLHTSHFYKTAERADVLLPAPLYGEEDGSYTNNEGRVQTLRPVRPQPQAQPSAREVFSLIAQAMGQAPLEVAADQVRSQITAGIPEFGQFDQSGKGAAGADPGNWPTAETSLPDPELHHDTSRPTDHRRFLVSGDNQFQSGQFSARSSVLTSLDSGPYVELNPGAGSDQTFEGMMATIFSAGGNFTAPLRINRAFDPKTVFVPERFLAELDKKLLSNADYPMVVDVVLSGLGGVGE